MTTAQDDGKVVSLTHRPQVKIETCIKNHLMMSREQFFELLSKVKPFEHHNLKVVDKIEKPN